jgi:hypothetical protein
VLKSNDASEFDGLDCSQAINKLLFELPAFSTISYFIMNGLYLGQYGDYASCQTSAKDSQFLLATVTGQYDGPFPFDRGVFGKYVPNDFAT